MGRVLKVSPGFGCPYGEEGKVETFVAVYSQNLCVLVDGAELGGVKPNNKRRMDQPRRYRLGGYSIEEYLEV